MKNWSLSFSWMRSLACIAIVVLHTMSYAMVSASSRGISLTTAQTMGASLVQYSCLWAVPLFVMVTGALLMEPARELSWEKLWKKYIPRVGGALLLFGALFFLFDLFMNGVQETLGNSSFYAAHPRPDAGYGYAVLCGVIDLLTGHSWAHMWYLYMILGLYLLMPFFKKITDACSRDDLMAFLAINVLFLSVIPLLGLLGIGTDYRFPVATIYPFYLFLGYVLHDRHFRLLRTFCWALFLISTVAIWLSVYFWKGDASSNLSYLTSYNSLPVVLQAASLFALLDKERSSEQPNDQKALLSFDKASFGIYLIHLVFIKVAFRYLALDPFAQIWIFPVVILTAILLSWICTWVLQRIPGIRNIV